MCGATSDSGFGTASFPVQIPCDDDWHVWARARDDGPGDAMTVSIDGGANELWDFDCSNAAGLSWHWTHLNFGDLGVLCETGMSNWEVLSWSAGPHTVLLRGANTSNTVSPYVSGLVVTNDASYVPTGPAFD